MDDGLYVIRSLACRDECIEPPDREHHEEAPCYRSGLARSLGTSECRSGDTEVAPAYRSMSTGAAASPAPYQAKSDAEVLAESRSAYNKLLDLATPT